MAQDTRCCTIFLTNIPFSVKHYHLEDAIATLLHSPPLSLIPVPRGCSPLNFDLSVWKSRKGGNVRHEGVLVIPVPATAQAFLRRGGLIIKGGIVKLRPSNRPASIREINSLLSEPYSGGEAARRKEAIELLPILKHLEVCFGHRTRDGKYGVMLDVKAAGLADSCQLRFDADERSMILGLVAPKSSLSQLSMRFTSIQKIYLDRRSRQVVIQPAISPTLQGVVGMDFTSSGDQDLPDLLAGISLDTAVNPQGDTLLERLHCIPGFEAQTPYALRHILLRFPSAVAVRDLEQTFRAVTQALGINEAVTVPITTTPSTAYGITCLERVQNMMSTFSPKVGLLAHGLLLNGLLTALEMTHLLSEVQVMTRHNELAAVLAMEALSRDDLLRFPELNEREQSDFQSVNAQACWKNSLRYSARAQRRPLPMDSDSHLRCSMLLATPTSMSLEGPYVDRSNRVLRQFPEHHDYFVRVAFREENLAFTLRGEPKHAAFVHRRYGQLMKNGIMLGGRKFEFLAYSQSSLKEATVWFVTPFNVASRFITAGSIRDGLGNFDRIITKPARYAARLSQAFSATFSSIRVEPEEIVMIPDIERSGSCFSDGCGCISPELAKEVNFKLFSKGIVSSGEATAFQIRLGGCKGMLFVNPALTGRLITIPPSMTKFETDSVVHLEIAEAFINPKPCFLSRPLVMILEDLGVPMKAFLSLQQKYLDRLQERSKTLGKLPSLLQEHSLGMVTEAAKTIEHFSQLSACYGRLPPQLELFLRASANVAKTTILRDIKFRARIPLDGCMMLVGGVDESYTLKEGQVYICIDRLGDDDSCQPTYLQGTVIVTRAPTLHPGDVRRLEAIGRPPSSYLKAQRNTIVFSANGDRSEPSKISSGDVDGDVYYIFTEAQKEIWPTKTYQAADYPPAIIRDLGRPSNIDDVADFVADYICNDLVGRISTRHLVLSDVYPEGIFHPECLKLSEMSSAALDFPKSGTPVMFAEASSPLKTSLERNADKHILCHLQIPRNPIRLSPDFTLKDPTPLIGHSKEYYESQRALGELFRNVDVTLGHAVSQYGSSTDRPASFASLLRGDYAQILQQAKSSHYGDRLIDTVSRYIDILSLDTETARRASDDMCMVSEEMRRMSRTYRLDSVWLTEQELYLTTLGGSVKDARRKELEGQIKEEMDYLWQVLRESIGGSARGLEGAAMHKKILRCAYHAWLAGLPGMPLFGAATYHLFALSTIYKALDALTRLGL